MQGKPCGAFEDSWILCESTSRHGKCYYFNKKTSESSWTIPQTCKSGCNANTELQKESIVYEPSNIASKNNMAHKTFKQTNNNRVISKITNIDSHKRRADIILPTTTKSPQNIEALDIHAGTTFPIYPIKNSAHERLAKLRKSLTKDAHKIKGQVKNKLSAFRDNAHPVQCSIDDSALLASSVSNRKIIRPKLAKNNRKCNTTPTFDNRSTSSSFNETKIHSQAKQETRGIKSAVRLEAPNKPNQKAKRSAKRSLEYQDNKGVGESKLIKRVANTYGAMECEPGLNLIDMACGKKANSELQMVSIVRKSPEITSKNTIIQKTLHQKCNVSKSNDIDTLNNTDIFSFETSTHTDTPLPINTAKNSANKRLAVLRKRLTKSASKVETQIKNRIRTVQDQGHSVQSMDEASVSGSSEGTIINHEPNQETRLIKIIPRLQMRNSVSKKKKNSVKRYREYQVNDEGASNSKLTKDLDNTIEDMEWETILNEINVVREEKNLHKKSLPWNATNLFKKDDNNFYIVVDTNIFITDLRFIKLILEPSFSAFPKKPTILIPWRVLQELDLLKSREQTRIKSRDAANYLRHELSSNARLKGQTLQDAYDFIYPCQSPDDEILNCCLQIANAEFTVILLSNDNILCTKAQVNYMKAFGTVMLKNYINENIEGKVIHEEKDNIEITIDDSKDKMLLIYLNMTTIIKYLLTKILRTEMELLFGKFWDKIVFIKPPLTYADVLKCFLKHWVAVFGEKFTSDFRNLLIDLREYAPKVQGNSISQENLEKYSQVALKLFDSAEVQRDYSVDASRCKEKAYELCKWFVNYNSMAECINNNGVRLTASESRVSTAFRTIWMFFCSYCFRVASIFNVEVENDVICFDMFPFTDQSSLLSQGPVIYKQLFNLLSAISDLVQLNEQETSENSRIKAENLNKMLCDTLSGVGHAGFCTTLEELKDYCIHNRSILQEGLEKFNMLYVILNKCQERCSEMAISPG